ncbi:hypothetical protein COCC4DRAFT_155561, partial [Bipolaris maydis ATCC 48331]
IAWPLLIVGEARLEHKLRIAFPTLLNTASYKSFISFTPHKIATPLIEQYNTRFV